MKHRDIDYIASQIENCRFSDLMEMAVNLQQMFDDGQAWDLTQQHQWAQMLYAWAENHMEEVREEEQNDQS